MRSIAVRETAENKTLFTRLVSGLTAVREDPNLRHALTRALAEGWSGPSAFVPAATTLILRGPMRPLIERAGAAWPGRPADAEFGRIALEALSDPLLRALMDSTVVHSVELEKFLAACRFVLLGIAEATAADDAAEPLLGIAGALARQCFINEYVYAEDEVEETRAAQLRDRLDAALASGEAASPLWVAAVATYFPLSSLAAAESLAARTWPGPVATLLAQQIHGPREEAALRATIRQLTPIEEGVSRAVQAQYEANPYPRWIRTGTPARYSDINTFLRDQFPTAQFHPLAKTGRLDILVAGCGTGQHAILTRRQHDGRLLAIDLSRSSLAYAATKTRELGLDIDYAQADIMRLGMLDRRFDLIESVGVLHHLADPYAGWRVLLSLLRPGGFIRIGLYSEIARAGVVAARAQIAREGYGDSAADIRRFRRDLMQRDDETVRSIIGINDFYSTSECRDLLFHVQEHRMTWLEIKDFLAAERLHPVGIEVDRSIARQYAMRYPDDVTLTDLDHWDAYERDNPRTFISMYRLWVQKPA
jgi:SAM-dependent methyltransferase